MKKNIFVLLASLMVLALALTGCGGTDAPAEGEATDKDVIKLGYVQWACANANSHMLEAVLEEKFDVDVELVAMEAGILWSSVATGDIDAMACAWLPGTHKAYAEELMNEVVDLGPMFEGARIGLVVPQYVEIDSIEELNANADKFNGEIVGIDAGAGVVAAANAALTDYNITDMQLLTSSDAAMTASLKTAYEEGEWIVVTGWTPHWMFGAFDLKFLDDPNGNFGGNETINVLTRQGFAEDHPEINAFLDNYSLDTAQYGALISMLEEYDDDAEGAQNWVAENRELVDSWFE